VGFILGINSRRKAKQKNKKKQSKKVKKKQSKKVKKLIDSTAALWYFSNVLNLFRMR
jgi:hypothetical protein